MTGVRVSLRLAELADSDLVRSWRNHPELVALSGSGSTVETDAHRQWFARKLGDPKVLFFIVQAADGVDSKPRDVGVLRVDPAAPGTGAVTIYLHPDEIGRGIGPPALRQALDAAFSRDPALERVEARVLADNRRSIRMFEGLGFLPEGDEPDGGKLVYGLRRDHWTAGAAANWSAQKHRIADYYADLIAAYGVSARACDYGRPESQRIKYKILAEAMPLAGATILDVGCGFAEFAGYLTERWQDVRYSGVDITPSCIARAKELRPDLDLRQLDILSDDPGGPYDFVTANGIFYLLAGEAEAIMHRIIERMYKLCTKAVGFNSLSGWCDDKQAREYYADPLAVLAFCRTLTPWVTLRHDYHTRDFTVYMYKERVA